MPEVICPSGLSGRVRPYRPGDWHRFTSDKQLQRKSIAEWELDIIKDIWLETIDVGPYAFTGKPPWGGAVLVSDRQEALLQARVHTSEKLHEVEDVECDGSTCDNEMDFEIHLGTDLRRNLVSEEVRDRYIEMFGEYQSDGKTPVDFKVCPPATLAALTGENKIEAVLPECGKRIVWQLSTGQVQSRSTQVAKQHGVSVQVNCTARLVELEGVERRDFFTYVCEEMSEDEFDWMAEEMDRYEPGPDTAIVVECKECGRETDHNIGVLNFYLPRRLRGLRKRRKSTSARRYRSTASGG